MLVSSADVLEETLTAIDIYYILTPLLRQRPVTGNARLRSKVQSVVPLVRTCYDNVVQRTDRQISLYSVYIVFHLICPP